MWEKVTKSLEELNISAFLLLLFYYHFSALCKKNGKFNRGAQRSRGFWLKQWQWSSGCISIARWSHPIVCKRCSWVYKWTKDRKKMRENTCMKTVEAGVQWATEWHNCQFDFCLALSVIFMTQHNLRESHWTVPDFCPLYMGKLLLLLKVATKSF